MKRDQKYRVKLYVTGGTNAAEQAVSSLCRLTRLLYGHIESEIVHVLLCPELFLDPMMRPLPVIVRESPGPVVRFEGVLADPEEIVRVLGLDCRD